jgi:hypothetical protein
LELLGIVIRFFLHSPLNRLLFLTRWIRFHVKKRIKQINMGYYFMVLEVLHMRTSKGRNIWI